MEICTCNGAKSYTTVGEVSNRLESEDYFYANRKAVGEEDCLPDQP
jgi:hypothetical protein